MTSPDSFFKFKLSSYSRESSVSYHAVSYNQDLFVMKAALYQELLWETQLGKKRLLMQLQLKCILKNWLDWVFLRVFIIVDLKH